MRKSSRLFEIIQLLRAASRPMTAAELAETLEVSPRTIYRDIAALQATRTPIEGEAGIGYIIRRSYDLPPMNFDQEEAEALYVGLSMLSRTGDAALQRAAERVCAKIDAVREGPDWLQVAPWGAPMDDPDKGCVSKADIRAAIREERKVRLVYRDSEEIETSRIVRPIALIYHLDCVLIAAWCELRRDFRHFRADRLYGLELLDERFEGQSQTLREIWGQQNSFG
ncbi:MAG: YafY family protein [Pseudomonadota bacterium]